MVITTGNRVASDLPGLIPYGAPLKMMFSDLQAEPDPSFLECMAPVSNQIIPEAQEMAQRTYEHAIDGKRFGSFRHDPISEDHLAVIMKYCQEDTVPALYKEANAACYKPDRQSVNPFKLFLWLLVRAVASLQPYSGTTVHCGVKKDLRGDYPKGRAFHWQGFTSTTKDLSVLTNEMFLGDSGPRTIFTIELTQKQARDISAYSPLPEGEVLLPPVSCFQVISVLQQIELTIIHLQELPSKEWILKLPQGITVELLEQQLQQTKADLGEALQQVDQLEQQQKATEAEKNAMEDQLKAAEDQLKTKADQLKSLADQLKATEDQLEAQHMQMAAEKSALQAKVKQLEDSQLALKSEMDDLRLKAEEAAALAAENAKKALQTEGLEKVESELKERDATIEKLKEEAEKMRKSMKQEEANLETAEKRYKALLTNVSMGAGQQHNMARTAAPRSVAASTGKAAGRIIDIQIVGAQGVGKSTLLENFIMAYDQDQLGRFQDQKSSLMAHHTIRIGERHLRLLDCSGIQRAQPLVRERFRISHWVFVVYDMSNQKTLELGCQLMEEANSFGAKVMLFGNKYPLENNTNPSGQVAQIAMAKDTAAKSEGLAIESLNLMDAVSLALNAPELCDAWLQRLDELERRLARCLE